MSKQSPKKSASTKKSPTKKATAAKKPVAKKAATAKKTTAAKKPAAKKAVATKKATAAKKPAAKKAAVSPAKAAAEAAASNTVKVPKDDSPSLDVSSTASGGFTLEDVRLVLDSKKQSSTEKQVPELKTKRKAVPKPKDKPQKKKPAKKKLAAASVTDILGFNPKKASVSPDRDESKVPAKLKSYYRSLLKFKSQLMEGLGERSEETIGTSARETSGELSVNSPDACSESFDRDVALSMVAGEQETLHEVEEAIARIIDGTY